MTKDERGQRGKMRQGEMRMRVGGEIVQAFCVSHKLATSGLDELWNRAD